MTWILWIYILNTENNNKDNNAFRSVIARRKLLDKFNIKGFDLPVINNKKGEEEEEDEEEDDEDEGEDKDEDEKEDNDDDDKDEEEEEDEGSSHPNEIE